MRVWNIKAAPPLSFTLAADARLGPTDYVNDQIWELTLGGGEPPAIAVQTTFGLRARSLRLFPRFREGAETIQDPASFDVPPTVQAFYPNYFRLVCSPFKQLIVTAEFWVPSSQAIAGRFKVENRGDAGRRLRLEMAANLSPADQGERMMPREIEQVTVLAGSSGGLHPILFVPQGEVAAAGVFPALAVELDLAPRESQIARWVEAALPNPEMGLGVARSVAAHKWEAELARIELTNEGTLEVYTGDPEWDLAFALGKKTAFGLVLSAFDQLDAPSFVVSRQPDHGYSPRGDGGDYSPLWNGQTPQDTYLLLDQILPAAPQLAEGFLRNFLATKTPEGFVDLKPGLAGQRSRLMATPLLATLAEKIYDVSGDRDFLAEIFPKLISFVQAWFTPDHDQDGDGVPEWDHPLQTGMDEHPLFSMWQANSQGVDPRTIESPDLCAYLSRECQALIRIADILGQSGTTIALRALVDNLKTAVEASWDNAQACYRYWDRDSHASGPAQVLGECLGPQELIVRKEFPSPVRLLISVEGENEAPRQITLFINGQGISGQNRLERIPPDDFRWHLNRGLATGARLYASIESMSIQGVGLQDRVIVQTVDTTGLDQTLLLPLWARMASKEHAQALVAATICNPQRFMGEVGLRSRMPAAAGGDSSRTVVQMFWNTLIGEGLLAYGYRAEAVALVVRLMKAVTRAIRNDGAFRHAYDAETGQGLGERNALGGVPPLGLFLATLGVQVQSPWCVSLNGFNPFPWPVTVKYRGLTVLCQSDKTTVIFPDGQTVIVDDANPCVVMQEIG